MRNTDIWMQKFYNFSRGNSMYLSLCHSNCELWCLNFILSALVKKYLKRCGLDSNILNLFNVLWCKLQEVWHFEMFHIHLLKKLGWCSIESMFCYLKKKVLLFNEGGKWEVKSNEFKSFKAWALFILCVHR